MREAQVFKGSKQKAGGGNLSRASLKENMSGGGHEGQRVNFKRLKGEGRLKLKDLKVIRDSINTSRRA